MNIIEKNIADIKPYGNNPRKNDSAVAPVANSIREFGFKVPIVIDKDGIIIAGHTRYRAAKELKLKTVPCIVADDLTEQQVKAFRLADNKVSEFATWDDDLLKDELEDILNLDMHDFGFDELNTNDITDIDDVDDSDVKAELAQVIKHGDIICMGNHRLMCGDATDGEAINLLMQDEMADMCVTDPPYNVAYQGKTADALTIANDDMSNDDFIEFLTKAFANINLTLKKGGVFYIWHADLEGLNFRLACKNNEMTIRECLIWNKNAMVLGRQDYQWKHEPCLYGWKEGASHYWGSDRKQTTVIDFDKPLRNGEHPTMKPVGLFAYQIQNSSRIGDVVIDVFGGSGTTLIACEETNRKARLMELSPEYCEVIIKRWCNLTGGDIKIIRNDECIRMRCNEWVSEDDH